MSEGMTIRAKLSGRFTAVFEVGVVRDGVEGVEQRTMSVKASEITKELSLDEAGRISTRIVIEKDGELWLGKLIELSPEWIAVQQ